MKKLLQTTAACCLLFTACGQNNATDDENNGWLPGKPEYYADGEVLHLRKATKGAGVNIVMVGEGFNHNDLRKGDGDYETTARRLNDLIMNFPVYKDMREYFNVYALCVESVDSGVDIMENNEVAIERNTRFNMPRAYSGPGGEVFEGIKQMVRNMPQISDISQTVVIMINNGMVGGFAYPDGTGFGIAVFSTLEPDWDYWMMHEFCGHIFGRLADEYCSGTGVADEGLRNTLRKDHANGQDRNSDMSTDPAESPWGAFIGRPGYEKVGFFQGAHYVCIGCYRPEESSVMLQHHLYYNAPSRYFIWERIMKIAGENSDIEEFFKYDVINLQ